jgi:hypothetical protein
VQVVLVPDHRAGLRDVLLLIDQLGKSVRQTECGLLEDYGHLASRGFSPWVAEIGVDVTTGGHHSVELQRVLMDL